MQKLKARLSDTLDMQYSIHLKKEAENKEYLFSVQMTNIMFFVIVCSYFRIGEMMKYRTITTPGCFYIRAVF